MTIDEALQEIQTQNTDAQGFIVQKNMDAGDSSSRTGIFYYLAAVLKLKADYKGKALNEGFNENLNSHEVTTGVYIRHPRISNNTYPNGTRVQGFVADPSEMGRDQMNPLIIALGEYPDQLARLNRWDSAQYNRYGRYQNKDIMGPQDYGMTIRAYKNKWHYFLLPLCDLGLVINSIFRLLGRLRDANDTTDDVLHSLMIIQAYYTAPTPVSWLARQIYNLSKPIKALQGYFSAQSGAAPLWFLYQEASKGILE
jgi:hypothetical protein